ncbi:hypothetical protein KQI52_00325 [bacterium]|nr:hypothetical protein [bacterium]
MSESTRQNVLMSSLLELSKTALRQARIEHMDALPETLAERERVLAELWGFDPEEGLPEEGPAEFGIPSPFDHAEPELLAEIRETDRQLQEVLQHNLGKISDQRQHLSRGERYMKDVRAAYGSQPESRYFDHVG